MSARRASTLVDAARRAGVGDPAILEVLGRLPRAAFVPADQTHNADQDQPVPIPRDQVTSQPSLVARMVGALELTGDETVLEVGTGYGFQTALLAHLCRFVVSVEWFADLAATARANLAGQGVANVTVVVGDGAAGVPAYAPYDAVLVSAAAHEIPGALVEQLADGGRLVQPIGAGGSEDVVCFEKRNTGLTRLYSVTPACFVRLRTAREPPASADETPRSDS